MAASSQLRDLVGAHTHARHLHRVMIADDTNSDSGMPRGVPRNPHHQKQMRAPTPTPRPAAAAAGKANSATTLQRNSGVCSRLQRRVTGASGSPHTTMWANQWPFPAAVAAPQPCAPVPLSSSVLKITKRRVCGSASTGRGTGGAGGWVWWRRNSKTESMWAQESKGTRTACTSGVPGSNPPGPKRGSPGRNANTVSVSQGGSKVADRF